MTLLRLGRFRIAVDHGFRRGNYDHHLVSIVWNRLGRFLRFGLLDFYLRFHWDRRER